MVGLNLNLGLGLGAQRGGAKLDPATVAYVSAMKIKPPVAEITLYNALIQHLKNDGVWEKLDCLQLYYSNLEYLDALINIINPSQRGQSIDDGTLITYEKKKGFTTATTGRFVDTGYNPSQSGAKLKYNDLFILVACHTTPSWSSNYEYWLSEGSGILALRSASTDTNRLTYFNICGDGRGVDLGWETKKWYAVNRLPSVADTVLCCSETDTDYISIGSSPPSIEGVPNITGTYKNVVLGAQNINGDITSNRRVTYPSYFAAGAGLTFAEFSLLKSRLLAYEAAMGTL